MAITRISLPPTLYCNAKYMYVKECDLVTNRNSLAVANADLVLRVLDENTRVPESLGFTLLDTMMRNVRLILRRILGVNQRKLCKGACIRSWVLEMRRRFRTDLDHPYVEVPLALSAFGDTRVVLD